jgi:hypothetical protein
MQQSWQVHSESSGGSPIMGLKQREAGQATKSDEGKLEHVDIAKYQYSKCLHIIDTMAIAQIVV